MCQQDKGANLKEPSKQIRGGEKKKKELTIKIYGIGLEINKYL